MHLDSLRPGAALRRSRLLSIAAASALALAAPAAASAAGTPPDVSANYMFQTAGSNQDPTFNQLLGINNSGVIAGYFGSGQKGHPNRGYTTRRPYARFQGENVPGAAQTQAIGINNTGDTVGFWVDGQGANHGFYKLHGRGFKTVDFPTNNNAKPKVDQLLGINDRGMTVGFYTDGKGTNHGFTYSIGKRRFHEIKPGGDTNVTASGINNLGDIAGFADNGGTTEGFLLRSDGKVFHLQVPGASMTQAFGVNDGDEVVGTYTVGSGNSAATHGFVWVPGIGYSTVDDPNGVGATTLNGINDRGTLVGFYTDSQGNTDGLVARGM